MRLFLSYSHKDMDRVKALQAMLNAMGHAAVRDEDFIRAYGDSWRDQIERIIRKHDAVIYAISPAAVTSTEVRDEIEKANKYHKPILHVKVVAFDDSANPMPRALDQFHIIDATNGMTDQVKDTLKRDLIRIINDHTLRRVSQIVATLLVIAVFGLLSLFAARNILPIAVQATLGLLTFTATPSSTATPTKTATATNTATATRTATSTPTSTPTFLATGNPTANDILLIMTDLDRTISCPTDLEQAVETKIKDAITQTEGARYARFHEIVPDETAAQAISDDWGAVIVIWGSCDDVAVKLNYTLRNVYGLRQQRRSVTEDELKAVAGASPRLLKSWIINNQGPDYVLAFVVAQLAYFSRNFDVALDNLNKTIELGKQISGDDPVYDQHLQIYSAYFLRGFIFWNAHYSPREALPDFDRAIQLNPQYTLAYVGRGFTKYDLGDYQGAIKDYDYAIQLDPQHTLAYFGRGLVKAVLGNYQDAIKDYDYAIQLAPEAEIAYARRGLAKKAIEDYQGAITDFDHAIQLDPKYTLAYTERGFSKTALGNYQAAIEDYDYAIQLDPKDVTPYLGRGFTKYSLGDYQGAVKDYDYAIQLDPQRALAYIGRGLAESNLGNYQAAIKDYDYAIQLDPQDSSAYYNRGGAKYSLNDYRGAIIDYNRAIQLDPQNSSAYFNRGNAKASLNNYQEAIIDYDRAIQLNPQIASAYFNRGLVYRQLRNYNAALADFRKYVELVPDDPNGLARIADIEAILTPQPTIAPPAFFASPTFPPTRTPKSSATP